MSSRRSSSRARKEVKYDFDSDDHEHPDSAYVDPKPKDERKRQRETALQLAEDRQLELVLKQSKAMAKEEERKRREKKNSSTNTTEDKDDVCKANYGAIHVASVTHTTHITSPSSRTMSVDMTEINAVNPKRKSLSLKKNNNQKMSSSYEPGPPKMLPQPANNVEDSTTDYESSSSESHSDLDPKKSAYDEEHSNTDNSGNDSDFAIAKEDPKQRKIMLKIKRPATRVETVVEPPKKVNTQNIVPSPVAATAVAKSTSIVPQAMNNTCANASLKATPLSIEHTTTSRTTPKVDHTPLGTSSATSHLRRKRQSSASISSMVTHRETVRPNTGHGKINIPTSQTPRPRLGLSRRGKFKSLHPNLTPGSTPQ
eukprot:CFRG0518T1